MTTLDLALYWVLGMLALGLSIELGWKLYHRFIFKTQLYWHEVADEFIMLICCVFLLIATMLF